MTLFVGNKMQMCNTWRHEQVKHEYEDDDDDARHDGNAVKRQGKRLKACTGICQVGSTPNS